MTSPGHPGSADAVVVGGGAIGGWCAYFLRRAGLDRVVLLEKGLLGQGASSRAAGVVRMQGGTPTAVRLGQWSRRFYLGQRDEIGIDSGFVAQGYLLPCSTEPEVATARERLAMQSSLGVPVRWLGPAEVDAVNPTLAPGQTLGGTFCDDDGYITPPRNVTAYAVALALSGGRRRPGGLGPAGRGHGGADADHGQDAVGRRRPGSRGVGVHPGALSLDAGDQ
jgi:sarcosine oxidase subunit beta